MYHKYDEAVSFYVEELFYKLFDVEIGEDTSVT